MARESQSRQFTEYFKSTGLGYLVAFAGQATVITGIVQENIGTIVGGGVAAVAGVLYGVYKEGTLKKDDRTNQYSSDITDRVE